MKESENTSKQPSPKGIIRAYQRVLKSKDGKIMLEDLKIHFGVDLPRFMPVTQGDGLAAKYDPLHAAVKDGAAQVMIHMEQFRDSKIEPDGEETKTKVLTKKDDASSKKESRKS